MDDTIDIRRVTTRPGDIKALLALEHDSTNDSDYALAEAVALLRRQAQHAYIAWADGAPAGFVACFESEGGPAPQLEVDLLGVASGFRGQGIARRLVAHACAAGRRRGARMARGVVREGNVASAKVFERVGFTASGPRRQMLVYPIKGLNPAPFLQAGDRWVVSDDGAYSVSPDAPPFSGSGRGRHVHAIRRDGLALAAAECLCVHTLAYSGIWIERLWSSDAAGAAGIGRAVVEWAKALALDDVGCLSPLDRFHQVATEALLSVGYEVAGEFDCFVMPL